MSLINQVLNELEKRGETAPLATPAIRSIPPRKRRDPLPYVAAAVVVCAGAAAMWFAAREEMPSAPAPAVAMSGEVKYELVPGLSASSPDTSLTIASAVTPVPADLSQIEAPASKLSFELSSIPLPGSLRTRPTPVKEEKAEIAAEPIRKIPAKSAAPQVKAAVPAAPANQAISPLKRITPRQQAEIEFNQAGQAAQQGRSEESIAGYERALRLDPLYHDARRALAGVLLALQRNADAERVLREGLTRDTHESSFAMLLARLQVERDDIPLALTTLEQALPHADQQPEYHAFYAALLQRQNRHKEAITHFQIALQFAPENGIWWMGAGISMQAVQRDEDARDAFRRALVTNGLSAQLQEFVRKKLAELGG